MATTEKTYVLSALQEETLAELLYCYLNDLIPSAVYKDVAKDLLSETFRYPESV